MHAMGLANRSIFMMMSHANTQYPLLEFDGFVYIAKFMS